jgi:hypothetical protein
MKVIFLMVFLSKKGFGILGSGGYAMTTATMTKTTKKRAGKRASFLPPSAGVTNVAGQELVIIPLDDFNEWLEDIALSALVEERLKDDGPYISREELDARLAKRDKRRAK